MWEIMHLLTGNQSCWGQQHSFSSNNSGFQWPFVAKRSFQAKFSFSPPTQLGQMENDRFCLLGEPSANLLPGNQSCWCLHGTSCEVNSWEPVWAGSKKTNLLELWRWSSPKGLWEAKRSEENRIGTIQVQTTWEQTIPASGTSWWQIWQTVQSESSSSTPTWTRKTSS